MFFIISRKKILPTALHAGIENIHFLPQNHHELSQRTEFSDIRQVRFFGNNATEIHEGDRWELITITLVISKKTRLK